MSMLFYFKFKLVPGDSLALRSYSFLHIGVYLINDVRIMGANQSFIYRFLLSYVVFCNTCCVFHLTLSLLHPYSILVVYVYL